MQSTEDRIYLDPGCDEPSQMLIPLQMEISNRGEVVRSILPGCIARVSSWTLASRDVIGEPRIACGRKDVARSLIGCPRDLSLKKWQGRSQGEQKSTTRSERQSKNTAIEPMGLSF